MENIACNTSNAISDNGRERTWSLVDLTKCQTTFEIYTFTFSPDFHLKFWPDLNVENYFKWKMFNCRLVQNSRLNLKFSAMFSLHLYFKYGSKSALICLYMWRKHCWKFQVKSAILYKSTIEMQGHFSLKVISNI